MKYSLIVFDLDFTLWNAGGTWCDHTNPPFRKENGYIKDSDNSIIFLYPEVQHILSQLAPNYSLAIASRTHQPNWALKLMNLFEIEHLFQHKEIYPGSKIEHFQQLHHITGTNFENMLFFDDEMRNVDEVAQLGVTTVLVSEGITKRIVKAHLA